jgi:hypothetical protein
MPDSRASLKRDKKYEKYNYSVLFISANDTDKYDFVSAQSYIWDEIYKNSGLRHDVDPIPKMG